MKISYRVIIVSFLAAALGLVFQAPAQTAEEDLKPKFEGATFFGGAGNQTARLMADSSGPWVMGGSVYGGHLYFTCLDHHNSLNPQSLVVKYTLPLGSSPVWTFHWPNNPNVQSVEWLYGVTATQEGLFCVGASKVPVVNRYGVWAQRGVLTKYSLSGATGTDTAGAQWVVRPFFFPSYDGNETLTDVIAVTEGGSTYLYATGFGEAGPAGAKAILAKFDTTGKLLWGKALGDVASKDASLGLHLAAMNGHIYVVGTYVPSAPYYLIDWRGNTRSALWKVDPSGNIVWMKHSTQLIMSIWHGHLAVSGGFIYAATTLKAGSKGGLDVLVLKYDEGGNLLWSKEWGSAKTDVARGITVVGKKLYLVGGTDRESLIEARDAFLLQMDAANGEVLSELTYGGVRDDIAHVVAISGKKLYVVGDARSFAEGGNLLDQNDIMILGYRLEPPMTLLSVPIDIKPGDKAPNPINLKSKGKIPVAILSTKEFDAPAIVDRATLTFGRTGQEKSMTSQSCGVEDVNKDGLLDLVAHFYTEKTMFQVEDTSGILRGKTLAGRLLQGIDLILTVPPEKGMKEEKPKIEKPFAPPVVRQPSPGQPPSSGVLRPKKGEVPSLKEGEVAY